MPFVTAEALPAYPMSVESVPHWWECHHFSATATTLRDSVTVCCFMLQPELRANSTQTDRSDVAFAQCLVQWCSLAVGDTLSPNIDCQTQRV